MDNDDKEDRFFQCEQNPAINSEITESGSNSQSLFSEISSSREGDCKNDSPKPRHVKRPSAVTFRDLKSNAMIVVSERSVDSQAGRRYPVRPKVERTGKKGKCHRCHKGNRFTEKVICISCDAKYCRNCVIRAMGSMPEGRKCITCIGYRIDESKRRTLGKSSRMLKHLMSEPQAKQIIYVEKISEANQTPPELVCVNGEPLNRNQMMLLLSGSNPPKKLKPGFYWYDKASGLWGKEGKRPTQIISPLLNVGGVLKENASNGNTKVFINNREITKEERWMLTAARVACEAEPNFWVNANGSYREEGQKNIKGNIWNKTAAKLACFVLSLPRPPTSVPLRSEERVNVFTQHCIRNKTLHKFLLVGSVKSGTSTIFKQAKLQYDVAFSPNELQNIKLVIQNTGYTIETVVYSISSRLKAFSDSLIKYMVSGNFGEIFPAAPSEYTSLVEELWRDSAIQATYDRRNELEMLPRNASYFLARAVEIFKTDYEPCDMDILYAEGITLSNSLAYMEFSFPKPIDEDCVFPECRHDPSFRKLFVSLVTGLEPDTVDEALSYARVIMAWEKWIPPSFKPEIITSMTTFEIEEASSF